MPFILINYLPPFSKIIGKKEEKFKVENDDTIKSLLEKLSNKYGEEFRSNVFDSTNEVKKVVGLLVNGIRISELDESFGQRLDIFLMLKGG